MRSGKPWRVTFRANRFDHVLQIFADTNFVVRLGFRCHFEDVRKDIVLRIVVDDFNTTFFVLAQGAKYSPILTHTYLLRPSCCKDSHDLIPSRTEAFKNRTCRNRNITHTRWPKRIATKKHMGARGQGGSPLVPKSKAYVDTKGLPPCPRAPMCLLVPSYPDRCCR